MKQKMSYRFLLPSLLGAGMLLMAACVHDSYEDCPVEGKVDIALTYYKHHKGNNDLFADEVNRAGFYIFDKDSLFFRCDVVENFSLATGYHHKLTLPGGDYIIVSWCNGGTAWKPEVLTPGVTTLSEARMMLEAVPTTQGGYAVTGLPETLFFGLPQKRQIHVKNGKTVCDSIDLMKLTHDIRLRIRWKDQNGVYCTYKGHEEVTKPYLEIKNGEYGFRADMQKERFLTYFPTYLPSEVETPIDYASVRSDYRVGRLLAEGSTARVVLAEQMKDGKLERRYVRSLVELIRLTGQYDTQEQIDREERFDVDIDLRCLDPHHTHANTWMVIGIRINGWVVSDIESEL